jgi:hypothetical protein
MKIAWLSHPPVVWQKRWCSRACRLHEHDRAQSKMNVSSISIIGNGPQKQKSFLSFIFQMGGRKKKGAVSVWHPTTISCCRRSASLPGIFLDRPTYVSRFYPTPQPQSATPIIYRHSPVPALPCNNNNHRYRFVCSVGEWWTVMDELLFVTCLSVISPNKTLKKEFHIVPLPPVEKPSVSVPLSFWLVTCKTIETGQFSNRQSLRARPTAELNRLSFGGRDDWHLSMMGDDAKDISLILFSFFFFPTRSW